jgi:hypothetical protein
VLFVLKKGQERLSDFCGRHHLKQVESLMKKSGAGERKFLLPQLVR